MSCNTDICKAMETIQSLIILPRLSGETKNLKLIESLLMELKISRSEKHGELSPHVSNTLTAKVDNFDRLVFRTLNTTERYGIFK